MPRPVQDHPNGPGPWADLCAELLSRPLTPAEGRAWLFILTPVIGVLAAGSIGVTKDNGHGGAPVKSPLRATD